MKRSGLRLCYGTSNDIYNPTRRITIREHKDPKMLREKSYSNKQRGENKGQGVHYMVHQKNGWGSRQETRNGRASVEQVRVAE